MTVKTSHLTRRLRHRDILLSASGPAEAYLATDIVTATPQRLARILYNAAIRLCRQAVDDLEDGQAQRATERIGRAQTVVAELRHLSGPGSFSRLYDRLNVQLREAADYRRREVVAAILVTLEARRAQWNNTVRQQIGDRSVSRDWVG